MLENKRNIYDDFKPSAPTRIFILNLFSKLFTNTFVSITPCNFIVHMNYYKKHKQ